MTDNDLNEQVEVTVDDATVITVPIDATLSNSNEAADAKAVGDALALKADKSELQAAVKVNNQPADAQGLILIDGSDIPVSDEDTDTLAEAVTNLKGKTAEDIPMSSDAGAKMIAEVVNANSEAIENMEEMTGATMPMEPGSQTMVKAAIEARAKTVNRQAPNIDGNIDLSVVPLAENLQSDKMQSVDGSFIIRTTGGSSSVSDGKAYPQHILGTVEHDGYVAEVLNMTVIPVTRTEPDEPITATIDRDTFVAAVTESGTTNLYYTTEWSEDPEDYGVTVSGTPVAGDHIKIEYTKEARGTIKVADPDRLIGTGWNLFNYNQGYARVVKYSTEYGYKIGGTYTSLAFSATLTGERSSITPGADGIFNVASDGYVFVTGGNNTDTYILATWSDWMDGPASGYWEPYKENGVDLSYIMSTYFPYGLLAVGTTRDEIDLAAKRAISRIERKEYSEENRAAAAATGRGYSFDENNVYIVRESPVLNAITIEGEYTVSEHGLEWFTETVMPLITEILYGKNLREKLERDVLTISPQNLAAEEQAQVRRNIGVMDPPLNGNGTAAQLLKTNGDGTTEWTTQGTPTDAQVGTAVSAWLEAHPEATTTVEDGVISRAKLNDDLKAKTDAVPDLKSAVEQFGCVEIQYTKHQYCNLSSSPITLTDGKPTGVTTSDNVQWGYIACQPGDRFTVSGLGYSNARLWAFVASDGTILLKASSGVLESEKIVIAPSGSALFITNTYNTGVSFKGLTYSRKDKYVQNNINVFDPDYFCKNASSNDFSTLSVTKTGVNLTAASAGTNRKIYTYLKLKANTEYVFRVQKHTAAGLGYVQADESNDNGKTYSSSPVISLLSSSSVDDRLYETTFTTTTGDIRINFYVSGSTSAAGSVVYSNIMLCEKASDPGFFVPYVTANDYYAQGLLKNIPSEIGYTLDKTGFKEIQKSDIIQGSYSRDGSVVTNSTRIRLKNLTPISVGDKIIFSPGTMANQMLIALVNNNMYIVETSFFGTATEYISTVSGFIMLLFKHRSGSSDVDITPDEYDAYVRIEYARQFDYGKEKYNGDMFRINYADAIPYPEKKANTYSVSYSDIIAKYDSIKERVTSLYSDVATNVPKPLTITKSNLQLTDSGYQMYKYTFTPAYPEKTVFVIAGTHGNEYEGIYCLYNMVKAIYTDMYGYPQLRKFREKVKLILIPVVNPYGFEHNCKKNGDGQNIYEQYNDGTTQSKEIISVKSVFSSENIDYFMDMHTDPYNATSSKNCYGYAITDSTTYPVLYNVIMCFRDIVYREFNAQSKYISDGKDIIVGRISSISGNNSVSYAERNNIPANVIEISTGFGWGGYDDDFDHYVPPNYPSFAGYGSSDMVRICTDFYTNVLLKMAEELLGI